MLGCYYATTTHTRCQIRIAFCTATQPSAINSALFATSLWPRSPAIFPSRQQFLGQPQPLVVSKSMLTLRPRASRQALASSAEPNDRCRPRLQRMPWCAGFFGLASPKPPASSTIPSARVIIFRVTSAFTFRSMFQISGSSEVSKRDCPLMPSHPPGFQFSSV